MDNAENERGFAKDLTTDEGLYDKGEPTAPSTVYAGEPSTYDHAAELRACNRRMALEYAAKTEGKNAKADRVVTTATAYLNFLES